MPQRGVSTTQARAVALAVTLASLTVGCSAGPSAPSTTRASASSATPSSAPPSTDPASTAPASTPSTPSAPSAASGRPTVSKVLVVMLENHDQERALKQMPELSRSARRYGTLTSYFAVTHPSLPNYLVIAGGSTAGVSDDDPPARHRLTGRTVFGQAMARGRTARVYAEGMTTTCQREDDGEYAVRHNPWAYYVRERAACRVDDVPAGSPTAGRLTRDVTRGTLPNVGMLVPNVCHDAHDCSLAEADSYLQGWLGAITAGPDFTSGRLAVVLTFDEDDRKHGNHVAAVVLHPSLHGQSVGRRLDHHDLSAGLSAVAGSRPLPGAARGLDPLTELGLTVGAVGLATGATTTAH